MTYVLNRSLILTGFMALLGFHSVDVFAHTTTPSSQKDQSYKKDFLEEIDTLFRKDLKDLDGVSHYQCYWDRDRVTGECAFYRNKPECKTLSEATKKVTLIDYQATLKQLKNYLHKSKDEALQRLGATRENSPKFHYNMQQEVRKLRVVFQNSLSGFNQMIAPVQKAYQAVYGTTTCR